MAADLPDYYFRIRDNGALVFRIGAENRSRRIDMDQIAAVNIKNGDIKAHGDRVLSAAEMAAIRAWMVQRAALLAQRETDDILRTIDHLNVTAGWVQTRASGAQLDEVTEALLMAMHDLRAVLVRKKADRLEKGDTPVGT